MITERIGLKVRFRTNVRSHIRWFAFLLSKEFMEDIKRRYETVANVNRLRKVVQQVVEEEIYSHESYKGEGNIKRSVTGATGTSETGAGVTVYFDPNVAPTKGPVSGGSTTDFNYAAFFDRPEFNSFILGSGIDVFSSIKYRPFREPMEQAVHDESQRNSVKAILNSVTFLRPKQRKAAA